MTGYASAVNGSLAQYIALALHGSAWLTHRGTPPPLEIDNTTFEYVSRVRFAPLLGDPVDGVDGWLERLANAGAEMIGLYLHVGEGEDLTRERERAGFVDNSKKIGLWVSTGDGAQLWRPDWRTWSHDPLGNPTRNSRPWYVMYRESQTSAQLPRPALAPARQALLEAIDDAVRFAGDQETPPPLTAMLVNARELDTAERPQPPFYPDMAAAGVLSAEGERLLAMAAGAFVFGGMATWNDIGFSDPQTQRTYDEVSDRLYAAVLLGLLASVNTGRQSRSPS
jgi:hypothetical protein